MLTHPEHLVSIPLSWEHIVWDFFYRLLLVAFVDNMGNQKLAINVNGEYNSQERKENKQKTNNDQQHSTHKTNDGATRSQLYIQVFRKGTLFVQLLKIPPGSIRKSYHHSTRISIRYRIIIALTYHLFTK